MNCKSLTVEKDTKILVCSPHPDDESIGCGGLLENYASQIDILLVTDGQHGNPEWTTNRTVRVRTAEFDEAMKFANVNSVFKMHLMDTEVDSNGDSFLDFDYGNYDLVFVPNRNDDHPDHRAVYSYVKRAIRRKKIGTIICEYEIWTPLSGFNRYVLFNKGFKAQLINHYKCQLAHMNYERLAGGLADYRGVMVKAPGTLGCEAYWIEKS